MNDKISIIVVGKSETTKGKLLFFNLMASLYNMQTLEPLNKTPIEVINVDDFGLTTTLVKAVKQPQPFNYNACLNEGVKHATGNYIYFANNDLIFSPGALDELLTQMKRHRLASASAICPKAHKNTVKRGVMLSYKVGTHFTGWGFMMQKAAYNLIGGLKTNCPFYCADNETVEQLKQYGLKHGLVKTAEIEHIGQQTQNDLDNKTAWAYTVESVEIFNKIYGQNIFGLNDKKTLKKV